MEIDDRASRARFYLLRFAIAALLLTGCAGADMEDEDALTASGFIEGRQVTVAPQVQGIVADLLVDRGDDVAAGDVVVRLDDATLRSQRSEAQAALSTAQANLERVLAGARAEEIAVARAALSEAEARRAGAEQAVLNARETISQPLSLQARIDVARTEVDLAEQNVELQEAELEETKIKRNVFAEHGGDVARTWDLQLSAAEARLSRARADLQGGRAYLGALLAIRDDPLTLQAELHRAVADLEQARAAVQEATAALDELTAGPTQEAVALAQAQVRQAEAGVQLMDARLDQLILRAPMDGIVSTRSAQVGETASAGRPLLAIANLDEVTLVLYIPENRIGQVQIGQRVEVSVDTFPERVFLGQVAKIAGEAEFTPRNVQTQEERVNLVFAVDVTIPNPGRALKPGLPADAKIVP